MTMKPELGSQGKDPKIAGSPWKLERPGAILLHSLGRSQLADP